MSQNESALSKMDGLLEIDRVKDVLSKKSNVLVHRSDQFQLESIHFHTDQSISDLARKDLQNDDVDVALLTVS